MGQDVSALGSLGALRQGQSQAELTAQQQAEGCDPQGSGRPRVPHKAGLAAPGPQ